MKLKKSYLIAVNLSWLALTTILTQPVLAQRTRQAETVVTDPEGRVIDHSQHGSAAEHGTSSSGHDEHSGAGHDHLTHIQAYRKETAYVHNLPVPPIYDGVGKSDLEINTKSAKAQQYFSQGVALLHCFWDFEAYRSFKEAIHQDSAAIMPYWGLYSAIGAIEGNDFDNDKRLAVRKLKQLKDKANEHEKLYAEAILYRDQSQGRADYQRQLELIVHKFPNDVDAKLFLALSKMSGYDTKLNPRDGQLYAEYLLRDILREHPENAGANHYWIHLKENCCPDEALTQSAKLASLAPQSGHMVHMPGHVYYKVGNYKKAYDTFIASVKVDSAYMKDQNIPEVDAWNFIHNVNYLLSNCAEDGRYGTALYYAERLKNMAVSVERKQKYEGRFFYQGVITPAKMELCFGFYKKAADRFKAIQNPGNIFSNKAIAYKDALYNFASGMDAVKRGKLDEAKKFADALDALLWRNTSQLDKDDNIAVRRLNDVNVASLELQGLIKAGENKFDEAFKLLNTAKEKEEDLGYSEPPSYARPVLISLGETYLKAKKYDEAIAAYTELLHKHPNSANPLWGLYKVYKQKGDAGKTREYLAKLNATIQYGDKSLFPL